jgi:hypothetical protein
MDSDNGGGVFSVKMGSGFFQTETAKKKKQKSKKIKK